METDREKMSEALSDVGRLAQVTKEMPGMLKLLPWVCFSVGVLVTFLGYTLFDVVTAEGPVSLFSRLLVFGSMGAGLMWAGHRLRVQRYIVLKHWYMIRDLIDYLKMKGLLDEYGDVIARSNRQIRQRRKPTA